MHRRDYGDVIGGAVLILIGSVVAYTVLTTLELGTAVRMGPGMFPAALGMILVALGAIIILMGLFRQGSLPEFDVRALLIVTVSILAFALVIRPFGIIPAIVVVTLIASLANPPISLVRVPVLAACLSAGAVLIFKIGLGAPVAVVNWPW